MKRRLFSVVVVGDGASRGEAVARVRAQNLSAEVEVVFPNHAAKVHRAAAWNAGAMASRGEVVVVLDCGALPADPRWLFHLTAPFADPRVAAVFARRLPRPGFMVRAPEGPPPAFDPACVALRRAEWEAHPFAPAEDGTGWAEAARARGMTLLHSAAAAFYFAEPVRPLSVIAAALQRRLPARLRLSR